MSHLASQGETASVYHQVRDAIINWEWLPGSPLFIKDLQARFKSRPAVARAIHSLESEGYISQVTRGRYIVALINEDEIRKNYRSIDFCYCEAVEAMISYMANGTIHPAIFQIIDKIHTETMEAISAGRFNLDDVYAVKYYYIMMLVASRDFNMMNYVLTIDKLRYSRWIGQAMDSATQETLVGLNFQLHKNIVEMTASRATSLLTYIFEEYRRLIGIYLGTMPELREPTDLDYSIVGDENPRNVPIGAAIDSEVISNFIGMVRNTMGDAWPHVFIERVI